MADAKEQLTFTLDTPLPLGVTRESGAAFEDIAANFQALGQLGVEGAVEALTSHDIDQLATIVALCRMRVEKVFYQMQVKYRLTLDDMSAALDKACKNRDEYAKSGRLEDFIASKKNADACEEQEEATDEDQG